MNKYFQNHKKIKILLVILIGLFLMGLEFGYILLNINSIKHYNSAIKTYNKLEKSNCIDDITEKNIDNEIKQISSYTIYYKKKEKLQKDFNNYKNYSSLKKEIDSYYDKDNIVKSTITLKKITEFNISNKKL